ncbi:MAG: hypothetical protein WAT23_08290 [Chromatiaceae bacterium]
MPETPRDGWGPDRLRAVAAGIEREFPLASRRTLLSLYDLDPDQLQAQWQVESGQLALVLGAFPVGLQGIHQRLRLLREDAGQLEVAALSLPAGEVDAQGVARFLVSGGPGVLYRAELGLATPEGGWILLARSNLATVPPRPPRVTATPPLGSVGDQGAEAHPPAPTRAPDQAESSPPWDPTLVDTGQELKPEFPEPPALATPSEDAGSRSLESHRSRSESNLKIQPLVIARNPAPVPDRPSSEKVAAPLLAVAPANPSDVMVLDVRQDSPHLATFDPRSSSSSPDSGLTSPGSPSGTWGDPGVQGLSASFWLFAYPSATPGSSGPIPRQPGPL